MGCTATVNPRAHPESVYSSLSPGLHTAELSPAQALAFQRLKSFYDQEKAYIPKKVEPYYRYVLSNTHHAVSQISIKLTNLELTGVQHLCRILPFYGDIEEFRMWKVTLEPLAVENIAGQLGYLKNLKLLVLEDDALEDEAILSLVSGFSHLSQLLSLDLSCNRITALGAEPLVSSLPCLSSLQSLRLDYNELEARGCKALCAQLVSLHRLRMLSLEGNSIDDLAVQTLGNLAASNAPEKVNLKSNRLSESGVNELKEKFKMGIVELELQIVTLLR